MQILTISESRIKSSLAAGLQSTEFEPDQQGLLVTSYYDELPGLGLIWTRCLDGLEGGWDVYDPTTGASTVVVLEPWEERLVRQTVRD